MNCPYCQHTDSRVVETRENHKENVTRRRRECKGCSDRFTTYERIESPAVTVEKRDGSTEPFDRDKIRDGLVRSCKKRPVSEDDIDRILTDLEADIRQSGKRTISSAEIGDMVIDHLKDLDEVAYLRFASIYRSFEDISSFEEEVETLKQAGQAAD